jgi:hypothetical protein
MSPRPIERFPQEWLALREAYDHAARSRVLARAFLRALPRGARIADLACGSGSNARYLDALGRRDLRWELIDADPALLSLAGKGRRASNLRWMDLARPRRSLDLGRCDGVTASALCDLVSGRWLDALIGGAARHGLPLLFALSIDGRVAFAPGAPGDREILDRFRRDQRRDKGFGPALGPQAPRRLARVLRDHGYRQCVARSDWRLGAADAQILRALVAGFADVARRAGSMTGGEIDRWLRLRREQIEDGRLALIVGHVDILAVRPRMRSQGVTLL